MQFLNAPGVTTMAVTPAFGIKPAPALRVWSIVLLLLLPLASFSQTKNPVEYKLKAAFLLNFLQFTEWPEKAFENASSPIVIGIVGDDPFGTVLDKIIQDEKIGNRPVVLRRARNLNSKELHHLLFISKSEKDNFPELIKGLQESPTLTVSEQPGFCEQGGTINFFIEEKKLRFEINPQAAQRAELKISAKMLRLAKIINDSE